MKKIVEWFKWKMDLMYSYYPCMQYYMDFTEEMIMNDRFPGYRAGRLEIRNSFLSSHSMEEQRIFTDRFGEFNKEFEKYMWKPTTLRRLKRNLKKFEKYYDIKVIENEMNL